MGAPWRLYLAAAATGLLAGLVGAAFHALLDHAGGLRSGVHGLLADAPVPGWLVLMGVGAVVLVSAAWLVRRFAPEAAGSGIQEVEAILAGDRRLRWRRVLPVKFVAGILAVGSGLVLGREGPTVHMGAALGQMSAEGLRLDQRQQRALVAAGAGAGLAAAFNAPLAAIVFVTEELREHFEYGFATLQSVILASCLAVAVSGWLLGQGPVLPLPPIAIPPVWVLPLFIVLGVAIGALGVIFNALLLGSIRAFKGLRGRYGYLPVALAGMALGALVWFFPKLVGGGESLVEALIQQPMAIMALAALLTLRLLTTVGSYGLGLPGGIFAPLLALGTVVGAVVDALVQGLAPGAALGAALSPGLFAVAAMGALFAATVRAPLTGIILAVELTGASDLILPVIVTCLTATFAAEALGGRPIYSLLLEESEGAAASRRPSGRQLAVAGTLVTALLLAAPLAQLIPPESRQDAVTADADLPARVAGASIQEPAEVTAESDRPPTEPDKVPTTEPAPTSAPEQVQPPALAETPNVTGDDGLAQAAPGSPEPRLEQPVTKLVPPTPDSASIQASATSPAGPRYTIQLASFRQRATVVLAARRNGILEQSSTLEPVRGWYPLLLGNYGTRAEAKAALEDLPQRLRRQGPIIRELGPDTPPLPLP
jgi:H+/Cl- antiporter ClcA/septal ring-binding cell division protein DamX